MLDTGGWMVGYLCFATETIAADEDDGCILVS